MSAAPKVLDYAAGRQRVTLGARLGSRCNNFDFIRLFAAFLVLYSHAFPLGGTPHEPLKEVTGFLTFGHLAVSVFFVISGMLVARSFLFDPKPISFLKKRSLRIFPGLLVCVLFCAFVVGPAFTELPLREYFASGATWKFLRNAALYPNAYRLPGVFQSLVTHPLEDSVNGSLWTLPLEFAMYLGVLALGAGGLLKKGPVAVLTFVGLGLICVLAVKQDWLARQNQKVWIEFTVRFGASFFLGTLLLLFADKVVLDWRWAMACLAVGAGVMARRHGAFVFPLWAREVVFTAALPYLLMYLAFLPAGPLSAVTKWGDFSYGVYLYAFPVQQIVYELALVKSPKYWWVTVALSAVGTLALAVLSWHFVEKPMLKLKKNTLHRAEVDNAACAVGTVPPGAKVERAA